MTHTIRTIGRLSEVGYRKRENYTCKYCMKTLKDKDEAIEHRRQGHIVEFVNYDPEWDSS